MNVKRKAKELDEKEQRHRHVQTEIENNSHIESTTQYKSSAFTQEEKRIRCIATFCINILIVFCPFYHLKIGRPRAESDVDMGKEPETAQKTQGNTYIQYTYIQAYMDMISQCRF